MEKVKVIEEAPVLLPNPEHKNFTESGEKIAEGTVLMGEFAIVKGHRRGVPFDYRIFRTNDHKIIYQNLVKPIMEKTEVTLGADAQVSPTKVDVPSNAKANKAPYIGAAVGAAAGFGFAKYKGYTGKKMWISIGVGLAAGFVAGKMYAKKKGIIVKPSK